MMEAQIFEHRLKIAECEEQLKTATGFRRSDILKYKKQLERDLKECYFWLGRDENGQVLHERGSL